MIEIDFPKATIRAENVISVTQPEVPAGRPSTRRWAFWAAYIIRQQLNGNGQRQLPYKFVSELVTRLLGRGEIATDETQIEFAKLRSETRKRASAMAKRMLAEALKESLTSEEFAADFRAR